MEKNQPYPLDELRRMITRLEIYRQSGDARRISSGMEPVDRLLGGGFSPGSLVEWFDPCEGAAAATLALAAARNACADGGALVVFDRRGEFYPVEAVRWGIDPRRLIVVQATARKDIAWAACEVLRSPAVGAMLAWAGRIDGRDFRRMQLAAEQGGGLGLLIRPEKTRGDPSWAEVRLTAEPLSSDGQRRRLRVRLLRARGVGGEHTVDVEIDEQTCRLYSVAQLARPAALARAARAS